MSVEKDILIAQFLRGELSEQERQSFMDRLASDTEFREQFLLEKQLTDSLDEDSWSFFENANTAEIKEYEAIFRSKETQQLKQAIQKAQESYNQSQKPKRNWILYVAAAAIITLFSVLLFNQSEESTDELFASYLQKSNLLALVNRNGNDSIFSLAQTSFDNKQYNRVVELLSPIADTTKNSNVYVYLAISDIELGAFSKAEKILNKLIASDLLDSQKGHWYKSLLYLKSNQLEKSKRELQLIIDSSFYQNDKAKNLIKKLK
jgi:hypothetical protein